MNMGKSSDRRKKASGEEKKERRKSAHGMIISAYLRAFNALDRNNVRYVLLRNHEFLREGGLPDHDLDISIHSKDMKKAGAALERAGFTANENKGYSLSHRGYMSYIPEERIRISLDIQAGGVYWRDIPYLGERIFSRAKEIRGIRKISSAGKSIRTLSDEDQLVMYICHSLLGKKRFKDKYWRIACRLAASKSVSGKAEKTLADTFGDKHAQEIMHLIKRRERKRLESMSRILRRNTMFGLPKLFPKMFLNTAKTIRFTWRYFFRSGRHTPLRRVPLLRCFLPGYPMITLMGPDGSGKTTNARMLKDVLKKNNRIAEIVYTGRGKSNLLPISRVGRAYKRIEKKRMKKKGSAIKRIIYTLAAPVYALDFLLRYLFRIYPLRRRGIYVITDRYASDMLLMKNVSLGFRRSILRLFPRPQITFYLYNTPKALYNRKPEHPLEELKRQMQHYEILVKMFDAIRIRTSDLEEDFEKIAEATLRELYRRGY